MNRPFRPMVFGSLCLILGCSKALKRPVALPDAPRAASATAESGFEKGMNLALQGDLQAALPHLRKIPLGELPEKKRVAAQNVLSRFDAAAPGPAADHMDAWAAKVLSAYQSYWSRVMLGIVTPEAGERELLDALIALEGGGANKASMDMDALEPKLKARLSERGYHALFGITQPFREFMLWRAEKDQIYSIDLPEGHEDVHIVMLDDFICMGWVGFATCDYYHAGGWTKPDRLYCVRSGYDLDSEAFHVSYLAHEGQHFSDCRRFPNLDQSEMEYRAKLVELALAETTLHGVLRSFSANVSGKRDQPHAYANRRAMRDLALALLRTEPPPGPWWERFPPAAIHDASVRLLKEDTARLQRGK